jgi:hypothetical protein
VVYVVENPVRAGLVESFEQYPFYGSKYANEDIRAWIEEIESWRQP